MNIRVINTSEKMGEALQLEDVPNPRSVLPPTPKETNTIFFSDFYEVHYRGTRECIRHPRGQQHRREVYSGFDTSIETVELVE